MQLTLLCCKLCISSHESDHPVRDCVALLDVQDTQRQVIESLPERLLSNDLCAFPILCRLLYLFRIGVELVERDEVLLVVCGGVLNLVEYLRQRGLE